MKIRKGKRRYVVIINHRTNIVYLTQEGSIFDCTYSPYLLSFSCNFQEAKHNIKVATSKGMMLSKRNK